MNSLDFIVAGIPASQGSMRAFVRNGHAAITHSSGKSLQAWRIAVAQEARAAMHEADLFEGSLTVRLLFRLLRPKSHSGRHGLLPSAPPYPAGPPDIDKLARACLDAMTGIVWRDDAQVSTLFASKDYGQPGVAVVVRERLP